MSAKELTTQNILDAKDRETEKLRDKILKVIVEMECPARIRKYNDKHYCKLDPRSSPKDCKCIRHLTSKCINNKRLSELWWVRGALRDLKKGTSSSLKALKKQKEFNAMDLVAQVKSKIRFRNKCHREDV